MVNKASKVMSSLVIAGSILALASGAAQATTLSWHDAPIMGTNVDFSVAGQLTVTVNGSDVLIPDSNALTSQFHFLSPGLAVWAASSVNLDASTPGHVGSDYAYVGHWDGPAAGDHFDFPVNVWGATGFTIGELYSAISGFVPEDLGLWQYTETWTGTAGDDTGAIITSVRHFCVDDGTGFCDTPEALSTILLDTQVPEPATLALLGLGLAGLGFGRRKRA